MPICMGARVRAEFKGCEMSVTYIPGRERSQVAHIASRAAERSLRPKDWGEGVSGRIRPTAGRPCKIGPAAPPFIREFSI